MKAAAPLIGAQPTPDGNQTRACPLSVNNFAYPVSRLLFLGDASSRQPFLGNSGDHQIPKTILFCFLFVCFRTNLRPFPKQAKGPYENSGVVKRHDHRVPGRKGTQAAPSWLSASRNWQQLTLRWLAQR